MLEFDWDEENVRHLARHGVTISEAEYALENPTLELDYQIVNEEERFVEVGATARGRVLELVTTFRGWKTRVVTAYDADPDIVEEYHQTR
ncbi:MAG TPA: BrnT family toxin [Acidobacteriaceae bacterium]|nr:BrnT family toxin [Acidobacteriaceae bacterium]